jgi:prevent-host-death family protein
MHVDGATVDMYMEMYIENQEMGVRRHYSVAEARSKLPALIREAEEGEAVEITRRGRAVAVVLSMTEYRRMGAQPVGFGEAFEAWRSRVGPARPRVPQRFFKALRDRSPGRRVSF